MRNRNTVTVTLTTEQMRTAKIALATVERRAVAAELARAAARYGPLGGAD